MLFSKPNFALLKICPLIEFFFPFYALWCEVLFHTEIALPLGQLNIHIKNLKKAKKLNKKGKFEEKP